MTAWNSKTLADIAAPTTCTLLLSVRMARRTELRPGSGRWSSTAPCSEVCVPQAGEDRSPREHFGAESGDEFAAAANDGQECRQRTPQQMERVTERYRASDAVVDRGAGGGDRRQIGQLRRLHPPDRDRIEQQEPGLLATDLLDREWNQLQALLEKEGAHRRKAAGSFGEIGGESAQGIGAELNPRRVDLPAELLRVVIEDAVSTGSELPDDRKGGIHVAVGWHVEHQDRLVHLIPQGWNRREPSWTSLSPLRPHLRTRMAALVTCKAPDPTYSLMFPGRAIIIVQMIREGPIWESILRRSERRLTGLG